MKRNSIALSALLALFILMVPSPLPAGDMRAVNLEQEKARAEFVEKARALKAKAQEEARSEEARIASGRESLRSEIAKLRSEIGRLKKEEGDLTRELEELGDQREKLDGRLAENAASRESLAAAVKKTARDAARIVEQSPFTALAPSRGRVLESISSGQSFPGMEDLQNLAAVLLDEARMSGEVRVARAPIMDRKGEPAEAEVLFLGRFTQAYEEAGKAGYLQYSQKSRLLYAVPGTLPSSISKGLKKYMQGKAEAVPMDISGGAALSRLARQVGLWERVRQGGPLVWPILLVAVLGVAIALERAGWLMLKNTDANALMRTVEKDGLAGQWENAEEFLRKQNGKPLARVLLQGLECRDSSRQDMENALQEAILKEIPAFERFLSFLGMLAAVAPLLGLLGTVTGMINTFQGITQYGTGDPRLLSGGISEALVTTMLGLSAAIPLILFHTLLSRRVENRIGRLEEKAVALVNLVYKTRSVNGS